MSDIRKIGEGDRRRPDSSPAGLAYTPDSNQGGAGLLVRVNDSEGSNWKSTGSDRMVINHYFRNNARTIQFSSPHMVAADITDKKILWVNDSDLTCNVLEIGLRPSAVETAGGELLNFEYVEPGTAPNGHGGGTVMLASDINTQTGLTANTMTLGTMHATAANRQVLHGGSVALQLSAAVEDLAGNFVFRGYFFSDAFSVPISGHDGSRTAGGPVLFNNNTGRAWKLVEVHASFQSAETIVGQMNLMIERLQGVEAPGSLNGGAGDQLIGANDIDLVAGTENTLYSGTIVTTNDVNILADGDRLGMLFVQNNGAQTLNPADCDGLSVTLVLVPTTLKTASTS